MASELGNSPEARGSLTASSATVVELGDMADGVALATTAAASAGDAKGAVADVGRTTTHEQSGCVESRNDSSTGIVNNEASDIDMDNGRLSEKNYADRFGSYYEYTAEEEEEPFPPSDAVRRVRRRNSAAHRSPPHGPLPLPPPQPQPPALRSTFKSEPLMQGRVGGGGSSSYSQTLENALFYSQAIRQIRETDCVDASNPCAVAMPRSRPGKEDIRQRRARNVIASREVFSITTPSAFIPLPSAKHGMWALEAMPELPSSIERSLAMRSSEPSIKLAVAAAAERKGGTAVPIARMLPSAAAGDATTLGGGGAVASGFFGRSYEHGGGSVGRSGEGRLESEWEAARRAGIDQPVPTAAEFAEGLKQRGVAMPRTAASSIITSRSVQLRQRQRPYSTAESAVLVYGSDDDEYVLPDAKRTSGMSQASRTQFRLSMTSQLSEAPQQQQHPLPEGRVQVSSHSRQVATRLLMRAGFSSIAIRVARLGRAPLAASAPSHSAAMLDSDDGVDADPNGLQTLRAARRKQVNRVDEHGFLHFDDDDERPSEYAQHYDAWRARRMRARSRAGASDEPPPRFVAGSDAKWETLLRSFDAATLRGSRKVKQLVQAGLPGRMRAQVYYALSGAVAVAVAGEYARLLALGPLPIFDVIERDVTRCYPDHAMFADAEGPGQRQLRRILRAYAHYNATVGYCQGMGRLVGLFLIVGLAEEQAFWVLAAAIQRYIPEYYVGDLRGLRVHTAVFEALLAERSPRLHAHLAEQGCDALMYATPWFMTVFSLSLPWPAALRVWDWFVFRGTKVLFRVALAITDMASVYLLEACPSITELLGFLLHIPPSLVDADALIAAAAKVKISERHVDRLTARLSARLDK